jgi:hypothetical protein
LFFQTFSLRHYDRFSLLRQEKEARRRLESYSLEERAELEFSRKEKRKEKRNENEKREKEKRKEKKKKKRKEKKEKKMML